jgi:hypothetical protein
MAAPDYKDLLGFQVMGDCLSIKILDGGDISDATVSPRRDCPGQIALYVHNSFPTLPDPTSGVIRQASTTFKECVDGFDPSRFLYKVLYKKAPSSHGLDE